ncbi:hypothetical protein GCM10022378_16040 [Salinicoccus jeotgali]|uniref:Uncharacterized protein n=1 Tax=Salinicoccus jeotgali TaxID=381634 RepID=A0ABP7F487_9STAP
MKSAEINEKNQPPPYYDAATIHNISLATLHDGIATILTTEKLISNFIE